MRKKELVFDRKFAKNVWSIDQNEYPEVLIIQGQRVVERNLQYVEEKLFNSSRRLDVGDVIIGKFKDKNFVFASGFGASLLADITHISILLGVKYIILIGTCGGLNFELNRNDIVIPKIVIGNDGVSDWYINKNKLIKTDDLVREELIKSLNYLNRKWFVGNTISVSSMLMENRKLINFWSESNLFGVDMEASAVFAVANKFQVKCGGLLFVMDNLIKEKDVVDFTEEERNIDKNLMRKMMNVAFYTGLNLLLRINN